MQELRKNIQNSFNEFIKQAETKDFLTILNDLEIRNKLIELFVNAVIKTEFEIFMGYKKYQRTSLEKTNYRNGYHHKKVNSINGELNIKIPEDRNYMFESSLVPKHLRRSEEISQAVIELFGLGLSNQEVIRFVDKVFGASYTKQTVSNIIEIVDEIVSEFKIRKLKKKYFAIFIDATYIPVRFANTFDKQAVHLMVGIDQDGYQEILAYKIGFSESTETWNQLLSSVKNRGVEQCDVFVLDGMVGVDKIIKQNFPLASIQQCTVHLMRNLTTKIHFKDRKQVLGRVKNIYLINDLALLKLEINNIINSFPQYERILTNYFNNDYMFTYLKFPICVHKTINSTNRIEAINSKIKTLIAHKRQFPSQKSLERILVSGIIEINTRSTRKVRGMEEYILTK